MEEDEEGQYDDITKYDEASSEDEQPIIVTEEPKSDKEQGEKYVPGKLAEEKTEFAKTSANGYDSMSKTEADSKPENIPSTTEEKGSQPNGCS